MRNPSKARLRIICLLAPLSSIGTAFAANSEADFKQAYATADAAEQEAGRLRNQWLATETALTDARKAAEKQDFETAITAAKAAEALAKASIFQATSEKDAWKNLQIR
ncbi:hypothetical protein [Bradyrhizobium sp.]|jgi:hypothetical protein|uniref:hypothetical protein n=1 Tax=Bradyrhizobium sp. TaxID=376 RepID=UPI003C1C1D7F